MGLFFLLPVFLGMAVVTQGHLNRDISLSLGLPTAVAINAGVFFVFSLLFYVVVRVSPDFFPDFLRVRTGMRSIPLWYLIPGICGFVLVLGLPWAFNNLGSAKTFILLVAAQVLFSLVWDFFISEIPLSKPVFAGAALTLVGASIAVLFK
jgi:transporter family-2 protein